MKSFFALPEWVQIWMVFILIPTNMASLFFINEPLGGWVAFLANIGMALNLPIIIKERGMSKLMSFPHLVPWTAVVIMIPIIFSDTTGTYSLYLQILFVVNVISLVFDYPDAWKWIKGDREIAGK